MQITIVVTMCVVNLVLWLIFFLKFKSLFSTDDVMKNTKEQYAQLMNDINRNTFENINLIDSKIEELNDAIENAERRILAADSEEKKLAKIPVKEVKKKTTRVSNINIAKSVVEHDEAFDVKVNSRSQSKRTKKETPAQNAESDVPKIYMTKNPLKPKRAFQERVVELYNLGYTIEQIAKETERSTTEVQFVIDML